MKWAWSLALGFLAGMLALAPAALFVPAPPLAALRVEGSLWRATLAGATLGQLRLGDIALQLQPAAILQGRLQWQAQGLVSGQIWRGFARAGVGRLNGRMEGSPLPGLPLAGVSLADVMATLDGAGRCQAAGGQVVADLALPLAGQRQLAGAPRCEGAALLLPLASSDGRVRLDVSSNAGRWTAKLVVAGTGPGEAAALMAAGFRSEAGTHVKEETGTW